MTSTLLLPLLSGQGPLALLVIVLVLFAETGLLVGFFLPGDSLLFTAGLLVATHVLPIHLGIVIAATWAAAALGDQVAYLIGRRLGHGLFSPDRSRFVSAKHVRGASEFFERHGHKAIILARFVPLARTFTPVVAGAVDMPHRRFTIYNVVGGGLWVSSMLLAGHFLGGIPLIAHHIDLVTLGIVALSLVPVSDVVHLTARSDDQAVELLVADEGPGVAESSVARLFEPGWSGTQGSGLGLALARRVARSGGGDVDLLERRNERGGATFVVRLPGGPAPA